MNTNVLLHKKSRKGFTLVELVVVILVMGIVAAVAAPKMFSAAGDARINTTKQSLIVVRNAIQLCKSDTEALPGDLGTQADFIADLALYIQGPFPKNLTPEALGDGSVAITETGSPLTVGGTEDWKYDNQSGEFIINTPTFGGF